MAEALTSILHAGARIRLNINDAHIILGINCKGTPLDNLLSLHLQYANLKLTSQWSTY